MKATSISLLFMLEGCW